VMLKQIFADFMLKSYDFSILIVLSFETERI